MKTTHKYIIGAAVLSLVGATTVSTLSNININVSANAASVLYPNQSVVMQHGFFGNTIHIRLPDELAEPQTLQNVLAAIETAGRNDTIIFHIQGSGGSVYSLYTLINAVHLSKAHTIMSVEGETYSAYSVLATQGDELKMSEYSLLHFHTSSLVNFDYSQQKGIDRGVSNVDHDKAYYEANMALSYRLLAHIKILSPSEKMLVMRGQDVYLTSEQVKERLANGSYKSPIADQKALEQEQFAEKINGYILKQTKVLKEQETLETLVDQYIV